MIGREKECRELDKLYNSGRAELVAVYGRRRVGKTYLVDEVFQGKITFRHAGLSPQGDEQQGLLRAQLDHFFNSLRLHGVESADRPNNWMDAFYLLEKFLQNVDDGGRQIIFLDELPWLDTPRSGFISAFEGFWNTWGCHRKNLMVIICGSATSWMVNELINNHGGLYGRVTHEIKLAPFNLNECEKFYKARNIPFSRYDIVQSYMIFGGIPYYMGYMNEEMSLAQNVDNVFFSKTAELKMEYDRLFESVFRRPDAIKAIVELLYTRNMGYSRSEIARNLKISDGGHLTKDLNALIASDFVIRYVPYGLSRKEDYYRLTDSFCLFYLHFVKNQTANNALFWQQNSSLPEIVSWRGYAFENTCFQHIEQIKVALGISGIISSESAWTKKADDEDGMQIDLLILRKDNAVNMCEIKFYSDDFVVSKEYYRTIHRRIENLSKKLSPKASIYSTLITTYGLKLNEYSGAFVKVITFDDLFK
ncbi:MAG: ATP-binding protein [Erysipelotrichaceae bacterium]|nr:ATP-binding protein [Erysipelotrichaceae bacterium]